MNLKALGRANPQQIAQEAGVQEVQLGALDQPLAEISVVRPQERHDETRLEDRKPSPGGGMGNSRVVSEGGQIEQLTVSAGAQPDKAAEGFDVTDVDDLSNVAFHVGSIIVAKPLLWIEVLVVDPGVEASEEGVHQIDPRRGFHSRKRSADRREWQALTARQLGQREWQQVEHGGAPGQRLTDGSQQQEVLRTGQDEPPGAASLIDDRLNVGEQIRCALHFIEDDRVTVLREESPRVLERETANVRILEGRVIVAGKGGSNERCLSRLPRTRQGHHRVAAGDLHQAGLECSLDHFFLRLNFQYSIYTRHPFRSREPVCPHRLFPAEPPGRSRMQRDRRSPSQVVESGVR